MNSYKQWTEEMWRSIPREEQDRLLHDRAKYRQKKFVSDIKLGMYELQAGLSLFDLFNTDSPIENEPGDYFHP